MEAARRSKMLFRSLRLALFALAVWFLLCAQAGSAQQVLPKPQEPRPPFPYKALEVTVETSDGVRLAGTLNVPAEGGTHPAVVLLPGSGPSDRDETMAGHKPFLVIADYLARAGFVVLRTDSREAGGSTGKYFDASGDRMARDALEEIEFLRKRAEVGSRSVGLLGHSLGGVVAAIAAAHSLAVSFLVLLSAPGRPDVENAAERLRARLRDKKTPAAEIERNVALLRKVTSNPDEPELAADLRPLTQAMAGDMVPADALNQVVDEQVKSMRSPWGRFFGSYDPRTALRNVHCPTLAISGSLDRALPPQENLAQLWSALSEAKNTDATVVELFGVNHLLQTATTGAPEEIEKIEETFAPRALGLIREWLKSHSQ
jgi:hypothetical protein